ncbi:MAG: killer suppression protein [Candidatus Tectomicrobia bacterium]|nr:killer suppression protein [Candidatus Tectomicrobia bacterium]
MDIVFKSGSLERECNDFKLLTKRHGSRRANLIGKRLFEISAASVLADLAKLPQARCHELKGNRKGQLALSLDGAYRLIIRPADKPVPVKPDGGLDWTKVTAVEILGVEDYHG